jgi:serine protease Do
MRTKSSSAGLLILLVAAAGACKRAPSALAARPEPQPERDLHAGAPGGACPASCQTLATIPEVAERVLPAVVNISSTRRVKAGGAEGHGPFFENPESRRFFGQRGRPREREEIGLGSGVIISADGLVATNNHVVSHAEEIKVTLPDRRELKARVIGADPLSDVAVIRVEGNDHSLPTLSWGNSDQLRLGEPVLAFGDPFGVGETVTMGIVSAKGRANLGIADYEDFIQTDAAINPGNSGGPLVNLKGELEGITTAIMSESGGYQGVGFAIPANMARPIIESLVKTGKVTRGYLGVSVQEIDSALASGLNLGDVKGVLVTDVTPNAPADRAGLQAGDVILKINGQDVPSSGELRNQVSSSAIGSKLQLEVQRGKKKLVISPIVAELPRTAEESTPKEESAAPEHPAAGLRVAALTPQLRAELEVPDRIAQGVVVTGVAADSEAARAGLRPGDVIVEVNRRPVAAPKELADAYHSANELLLRVYRKPAFLYVILKRPGRIG